MMRNNPEMVKSSEKQLTWLGHWLQDKFAETGKTKKDLGLFLGRDASKGTRLLTAIDVPTRELQAIADFFGDPVPTGPDRTSFIQPHSTPITISEAPSYAPLLSTIPIYATKRKDWYEMDIGPEVEDRVAAPWFSHNALNTFGFRLCTENMAPAYDNGDIVIINRLIPGRRHKAVLFAGDPTTQPFSGIIGILDGQNTTDWIVCDLVPGDETPLRRKLSKNVWPNTFLILGKAVG